MNGLDIDTGTVRRALSAQAEHCRRAALEAGQAIAGRMEDRARAFAPWRDRTGRARRSIVARAEADGARVRVRLYGMAPYSAALERARGARYAVIAPTVRACAPEFVRLIAKGGIS